MRVRALKRSLLGCCLAVSLLALPAGAQAATVRVEDHFDDRSSTTTQEVVYDAAPGEVNRLQVRLAQSRFVGLIDSAGITPGRGCRRLENNPTRALCELTAQDDFDFGGITVNAGDQDDSVRLFDLGGTLRGGAGNDELIGGPSSNFFEGGPGFDEMSGGADRDFFEEGSSPKGPDHISGNDGEDVVTYSGRRHKIHADLQGDADDGEIGERDRIDDDVENLVGGRADDRLTGNRVQNTLIGEGGSDLLKAAGGDDELWANDEFGNSRRRTRDRLDGGSGRDTLNGSEGANRLSGGPGPDIVFGEGGNDRIRDRDGRIDRIQCGRGRDRASLDGFDFFADRCERVRRSFLPAGIPLSLDASSDRGGTALVEVGCPRDGPRVCHGRVVLRRGGRMLGSNKFAARRGHAKDVAVRLPPGLSGGAVSVTVRSHDALRRIRVIRAALELPPF